MALNGSSDSNRLNLSLNLRFVCVILLSIIIVMAVVWKPWVSRAESGRTITVSGEAKISAQPDEYVFQPSYEFKDPSKQAALAALTIKSNELVKKLKELGVASGKIAINSDSYNYYFNDTSNDFTYALRPTIKVSKGALVQKVQDYLVGTTPTGQISPQATFSDTYKTLLESEVRDKATKDARKKADQTAGNLGFKVAKIKSVDDTGNSVGGPVPSLMMDTLNSAAASEKPASLSVMPGENDLTYSVRVVYYIR